MLPSVLPEPRSPLPRTVVWPEDKPGYLVAVLCDKTPWGGAVVVYNRNDDAAYVAEPNAAELPRVITALHDIADARACAGATGPCPIRVLRYGIRGLKHGELWLTAGLLAAIQRHQAQC